MEDELILIAQLDEDKAVSRLDRYIQKHIQGSLSTVKAHQRLMYNLFAWCVFNNQVELFEYYLGESHFYHEQPDPDTLKAEDIALFDDFFSVLATSDEQRYHACEPEKQHPILSQYFKREGLSFCVNSAMLVQALSLYLEANPNTLISVFTAENMCGLYYDQREGDLLYYHSNQPFSLYKLAAEGEQTIQEIVDNIFETYYEQNVKKNDVCALSILVYAKTPTDPLHQERQARRLIKRWKRNQLKFEDTKKNHALHMASIFNHFATLDLIQNEFPEEPIVNQQGIQPIHYALANQNQEFLQRLLAMQPALNDQMNEQVSLLDIVAWTGNVAQFEQLMDMENITTLTQNPLNIAMLMGHEAIIEKLIASLFSRYENHFLAAPPVQVATELGRQDIVIKLLEELNFDDLSLDFFHAILCGEEQIALILFEHLDSDAQIEQAMCVAIKKGMHTLLKTVIDAGLTLSPIYLAEAIRYNQVTMIQALHTAMGALDTIDFDDTSIIAALQACSFETFKMLVEQGMPMVWVDDSAHSLLWNLVDSLELKKIVCALPLNNAPVGDYNPLTLAIERGDKKIATVLIKYRGLLEAFSEDDASPLTIAFKENNNSMAKILLERGANLEAANKDYTLAELVVKNRNKQGFELLKSVNYDFSKSGLALNYAIDQTDFEWAKELIELGVEFDNPINHMTPLQRSTLLNQPELCELLINKGANIENTGPVGYTPLGASIRGQNWPLTELFLAWGAKVNVEPDQVPPICPAAQVNFEWVEKLLDKGANPNVSYKGYTPLHYAINHSSIEEVEILINAGADIFYSEANQDSIPVSSPLAYAIEKKEYALINVMLQSMMPGQREANQPMLAKLAYSICRENDVEMMDVLINNEVDFNTMGDSGNYPLHAVVRNGNEYYVKMLLMKGVDVNAQNEFGVTPLHYAMQQGKLEIIQLLLDGGAELDIEDYEGALPLDVANANRLSEIKKMLNRMQYK